MYFIYMKYKQLELLKKREKERKIEGCIQVIKPLEINIKTNNCTTIAQLFNTIFQF